MIIVPNTNRLSVHTCSVPIRLLDKEHSHSAENSNETVLAEQLDDETNQPNTIYLCGVCHYPITSDAEITEYMGQQQFLFANPAGHSFYIQLFNNAWGCDVHGNPTLEATWFTGHPWRYAHCQQCKRHLGWQYLGGIQEAASPQSAEAAFYGLIANLLIAKSLDQS